MISKETRYLEKIKSDLDEGLFDLFTTHILEIGVSIKLFGDNAKEMISLLSLAIDLIMEKTSDSNKFFMNRYLLICANKLLFLDKNHSGVKELKKKVIAEYTHQESIEEGRIPLDDQLTEVRITYDITYLVYLVKKLIEEDKQYVKALYCFEAIKIIEPDNNIIDKYQEFFDKEIPSVPAPENTLATPKDLLLVLDANVVISKILYNVGDFRIFSGDTFDLENLGNNNKFVILPSVVEEVKDHMKVEFYKIDIICSKIKKFNAEDIKAEIQRRYEKIVKKYSITKKVDGKEFVSSIRSFYHKNNSLLRTILEEKINREATRSHKLRRIAKRNALLPEQGDIELLSECIALQKTTDKKIGILSRDGDFQYFANEIEKDFNIKVVGE